MTIEGKVVSIGLHRDSRQYAVVEVVDARYPSSTDSIHIANNGGVFAPGDRVMLTIEPKTNLMDAPQPFDEPKSIADRYFREDEHVGQRGWGQE